jgi:hypothetical protein
MTRRRRALLLEAQRFVKRRCDMNRITRMLTITGLGVFAGVTIGAGPAMAASGSGRGAAQTATIAKPADRVAGYYDTYRACDFAGRMGERVGSWDDYNCQRTDSGEWALVVDDNGPSGNALTAGGWDNGDWDNGDWNDGGWVSGGWAGHAHHGGAGHQHKAHAQGDSVKGDKVKGDKVKGSTGNNVGMPAAKPHHD